MEFKDAKYVKDYMDEEKKTEPYITISCTVNNIITDIFLQQHNQVLRLEF